MRSSAVLADHALAGVARVVLRRHRFWRWCCCGGCRIVIGHLMLRVRAAGPLGRAVLDLRIGKEMVGQRGLLPRMFGPRGQVGVVHATRGLVITRLRRRRVLLDMRLDKVEIGTRPSSERAPGSPGHGRHGQENGRR